MKDRGSFHLDLREDAGPVLLAVLSRRVGGPLAALLERRRAAGPASTATARAGAGGGTNLATRAAAFLDLASTCRPMASSSLSVCAETAVEAEDRRELVEYSDIHRSRPAAAVSR